MFLSLIHIYALMSLSLFFPLILAYMAKAGTGADATEHYLQTLSLIHISSPMLSEIELIADDIGMLNHGRLLFEGSMNDLRQYALQSGFAADNLEDVFLSMVEKDNMDRKQIKLLILINVKAALLIPICISQMRNLCYICTVITEKKY